MNKLLRVAHNVCILFLVLVCGRTVGAVTKVAVCLAVWSAHQVEQWQPVFKANSGISFLIITTSVQNNISEAFSNGRVATVQSFRVPEATTTDSWATSANTFVDCTRQIEVLEKKLGGKVDFVFNAASGLHFYRDFELEPLAALLSGSGDQWQSTSTHKYASCDVITRSCPSDHGIAQHGYFWARDTAVNVSLLREEFGNMLSRQERSGVAVEVLEQRMLHLNAITVCAVPVDQFPVIAMRSSVDGKQLCIPREEVEAGCYPAGMEAFAQDHVCRAAGGGPQRRLQQATERSSPSEGIAMAATGSEVAVPGTGIERSDTSTGPSAKRRPYSAAAVEESLLVRLKEMELRARALEYKLKETVRGISKSQAALVHENKALRHELVTTKKEMSDSASRLASASGQLANMRSAYDRQAAQLELCRVRLDRVDWRQHKHSPQAQTPHPPQEPQRHQEQRGQEPGEGREGQQQVSLGSEDQQANRDRAQAASPEAKRLKDASWFHWV